MGYGEVMNLPIRTFWMLNSNVPRILAEMDMRSLQVAMNAQSAEGSREFLDHLKIELGDVMKVDPIQSAVRDEEGFQKLKALASM